MRYVCHPHLYHPPEKIKLLGVSHSFANYSTFYVEIYKRIKSVCFLRPQNKTNVMAKTVFGFSEKAYPFHYHVPVN
jgi:hypothetical protein